MTQQLPPNFPQSFLDKLNSVTNKRARVVIEHILQHGSITTQELKDVYGYNHPPRAAKDVRDEGIPLETFRVKGPDGRSIAAYRFGDISAFVPGRQGGRKPLSRKLKRSLYEQAGGKCAFCNRKFELREVQLDHCIPYEISGDASSPAESPESFLIACGSCNRAKSWSCEHCPNWVDVALHHFLLFYTFCRLDRIRTFTTNHIRYTVTSLFESQQALLYRRPTWQQQKRFSTTGRPTPIPMGFTTRAGWPMAWRPLPT